MRISCPVGTEPLAMPLQAERMKMPFRTGLLHSGRQSSIRIRSRKTVSEFQPRSSTRPEASGSEKETVRLHGHGLRSSLTVQAAQTTRIAVKETERRILSIINSGVFMDRICWIPVASGGVEYNVNRAGLVLFGIGGTQFSDDCFLDDVGFVPLHCW